MNAQPKEFAWSFSKLKNYETCPRRYAEVDLKKSVEERKSIELARGEELHEAMRARVQGEIALPPEFIYMEKWAERLTRVLDPFQIIQCELKLAIDREGKPTGYFEKGTWLRGRIDYLRIIPTPTPGKFAGHVVDYKTGKMPKVWDGTQLIVNAYMVFCHYKDVDELRVDYLWTEYSDTTHEKFKRSEIANEMATLLPRVSSMETAHVEGEFTPRPCGLCELYCPVTSCEYNGKPYRRDRVKAA